MANESKDERLDRELIELLNELRVALPGVQVLFAFLLTVPFSQRFGQLTGLQRDVYFGTFLATALASLLFIAPTAYHRLRWRDRDKEQLLQTSNREAIAGTVFLATAITGTVFVITDVLFGVPWASAIAGAFAGLLVWLWYGIPLTRRARERS
jgi:predicted membrane channel-forming protein YqfA (hemolysin III family)